MLGRRVVLLTVWRNFKCQHVPGIEARINPAQAYKSANQQARSNHQYQRERDLRYDQRAAHTPSIIPDGSLSATLFEGVIDIYSSGF